MGGGLGATSLGVSMKSKSSLWLDVEKLTFRIFKSSNETNIIKYGNELFSSGIILVLVQ